MPDRPLGFTTGSVACAKDYDTSRSILATRRTGPIEEGLHPAWNNLLTSDHMHIDGHLSLTSRISFPELKVGSPIPLGIFVCALQQMSGVACRTHAVIRSGLAL